MSRSLGVTSLAILTIGVSLAVLATFALVVGNLRRVASELGDDVGLSAYLEREAVGSGRAALPEVREWDGVARAWVLTSSQAMAGFKTQLGKEAVLLEGLPDDVIPPSLELRLVDRAWKADEVRVIAAQLEQLPGVEDVQFGQEDIERVTAILGIARGAAFVLGTALCFATVLIIYNTIRLTLYARRDEIEIMSLVGATASFVRAPFVLEGTIQGIIGGLAASAALFALDELMLVALERGLAYVRGSGVALELFPTWLGFVLVAAGAGLGLVGSLLAVGKFLRL